MPPAGAVASSFRLPSACPYRHSVTLVVVVGTPKSALATLCCGTSCQRSDEGPEGVARIESLALAAAPHAATPQHVAATGVCVQTPAGPHTSAVQRSPSPAQGAPVSARHR